MPHAPARPTRRRPARRIAHGPAALAVAAALALAAAPPSQAQNRPTADINIPALPLAQALNELARQAGRQLLVAPESVAGKTAPALRGRFDPLQALRSLLAGSGLEALEQPGGAFVVRKVPEPAASEPAVPTLAPVTVVARPEAPGEPPKAYAGGQVARGGRIGLLGDLDYMDTPFSTTNLTAKTVQDEQARTIGDLLHDDASVQPHFPRSSFTDVIDIRGFALYSSDYAINGLYGLAPSNKTMAELVERVEIFKGPSALLNGVSPGGAVGGSINLLTKRAPDKPLTQFTADYTSRAQVGGHLDVGRRFGENNEWGVRFNGAYRDGDLPTERQGDRLQLGALGLDYRGDRLRASLDLIAQKQNMRSALSQVYYDFGGPLPAPPKADANFQQPWEYESSTDKLGLARVEYDVSDAVTAYVTGGLYRGKATQLRGIPYNYTPDGTFTDSPFYDRAYNHNASAEAGVRLKFATGPVKHAMSVAASKVWLKSGDDCCGTYAEYQSNLYQPVFAPAPQVFATGAIPQAGDTRLSSVAVADVMSLLGDRLQLIGGVRLQRVATASFDADTTSPTLGQTTSQYDERAWTPTLGVVFRPADAVSVYASYIQGLQQGPTAPSDADYVNRGQVFPPSKTAQVEAGVKLDLGQVGATLAVFRIAQPSGRTILLDDGQKQFAVDGEQVNRGVELGVFGEPLKGVRTLGGATYLEAKVARSDDPTLVGKTQAGVPRLTLNLGAEWDVPALPGLTLTGRAVRKSRQYYFDYAQTIPAWTRFDLGARCAFVAQGRPVTLRASVDNVRNSNYWESSGNGLLLASPRTVQLSATVDF